MYKCPWISIVIHLIDLFCHNMNHLHFTLSFVFTSSVIISNFQFFCHLISIIWSNVNVNVNMTIKTFVTSDCTLPDTIAKRQTYRSKTCPRKRQNGQTWVVLLCSYWHRHLNRSCIDRSLDTLCSPKLCIKWSIASQGHIQISVNHSIRIWLSGQHL